MKKMVIVTHPNKAASKINKSWINELKKHPHDFTIHSLYDSYPSLNFDVDKEQSLLLAHDEIIFQFPFHWFSTPFALKKYIDEVLTYGWAFGPNGDKIKGKKIHFAVSTGGKRESYEGASVLSVSELLNDITLSFQYCGCVTGKLHTFYGAMFDPSAQSIEENTRAYISTFK
ncbi:NAD(P)H-dependent oxidoreductase [uncultured Croceitalea sp.]|uniref:NAD(P)H-dependent oxidoreductase n=1 Tax=uncultured Croceitalea sp. TaxID=1798908 RepID=UPI0033056B2A